jgi:hypothetical protein
LTHTGCLVTQLLLHLGALWERLVALMESPIPVLERWLVVLSERLFPHSLLLCRQDQEGQSRLFCGVFLFLMTGGMSIYILSHADQETERLLKLTKLWGPQKTDDAVAFQKIRRRLIIGYWGFLIVSIYGLLRLGMELYKRL